jgi:ribulose-5-phosphate 4-epimerase/fuculose-1-phosphate aldolase
VDVEEMKRTVALACRMLGHEGVTQAAFGHVSARIPGTDRILIKARGPEENPLEFTEVGDIITIDLKGKVVEGRPGLEAPHETAMHLIVYQRRPEVMSVIHTHPTWVVALTACGKPLVPLFAAYNPPAMRLAVEGIPVFERSVTIVNAELAEAFYACLGERPACLLRGHGMTTVGRSVEEATLVSLRVFELARVNYLAWAVGEPQPVLPEDLAWYQARFRQEGGGPGRDRSGWVNALKRLQLVGLGDVEGPRREAPEA